MPGVNKFHCTKNPLIKFTNGTKLGELANMLDGKKEDSERPYKTGIMGPQQQGKI